MSIQALREQRAAIGKRLQELVNAEDWSADRDQPIYDEGMAEIEHIDARIARIEQVNARVAEEARTQAVADAAARLGRDNRDPGLSIYARWLKGGDAALSADDWAHVRAAQSTTVPSQGGFTVDSSVATQVLDALKAFGGMRSVATVLQTATGAPMSFPTSNGTAEKGRIVPENQTATDADVTFGTISLPVYKYESKVVAVPFELLQDSSVDIETFVRARLVERIARITNEHFTTGTGAGMPHGIVTAATGGDTGAIGYDKLVDLQHKVDPAYRQRAGWMFNDATMAIVRKVKDQSQRPIFAPGYEVGNPAGAPDRLLGSPITINHDMPAHTSTNRGVLFGDFSHYHIRDVMAVEMFRFTDSAFTKKGQVGFLAWMRSGGNLIDVGGAVQALAAS